jgi:hypothetical protein
MKSVLSCMTAFFRWMSVVFLTLFVSLTHGQPFQSSNLPIIILDTHGAFIRDEPKTFVDLKIIDNGPGARNNLTDAPIFSSKIGIEIRGSSSQMFPKKQYGFELLDNVNVAYDTSLLGLPAENDWILFAPYNDKTLIRDVLAYDLARKQGRYAPRTKYCELLINGAYEGLYVLIEKIKRDNDRVDIAKLEPDDNSGDAVTGGYIIKIDKLTGDFDTGWFSEYPPPSRTGNAMINFLFEYPDPEDITAAQRDYIKQHIQAFETTLIGSDFANPVDGYARFIDMDSFVDFMIINEVSKNVDGYRLSTYFHKQKNSDGGKIVMGPVWDFNLGFGNADYCTKGITNGLVLDFNEICGRDTWLIPFWWNRLLQDVTFSKKLQTRWNGLRDSSLATNKIHDYIDSVTAVLGESQVRNFSRWPVLGQYVWPNYFVGSTYQQEVDWLKNWVTGRMDWLDVYMEGIVTSNEGIYQGLQSVAVFPNPSQTHFNFRVEIAPPGKISLQLFDPLGREVQALDTWSEQKLIEASLGEALNAGPYFYKISVNGQVVRTGKLMKR